MNMHYDVVIVGCGVAGCYAALHLPKEERVLVITKAKPEESDSFLAQGGICVQKDSNDYEAFYEDTMRAGHYENSQSSVEVMIRSSRAVIAQLISYGVEFNREQGELCYTREGAHSTNRILFHDDVTGKEITSTLLERVGELPNVTLLSHTTMLDILTDGRQCEGVLVRTKEGELRPIFARDVIWACGGIGGIYENSTNFPHLTGDALAIALKRGIALKNVNYVQIHPTTLYSKKPGRRFLISESVRGEGAVLLDRERNRFTDELQPRDVVSAAIFRQMEKDHTSHVWLSFAPIRLDVKKRFPNIYQKCLEE
ncbi:MAG: FAD-dependent oxidoreductase, partial [Fusicatenibacter sp.]